MTDVPKGRDTKDRKTKEDQDRDWMNASNKPGNLVLLDRRPRKDSPPTGFGGSVDLPTV